MTDAECREIAELAAELRALRDRQEIVDVVYRYARGLDRHDAEIFSSAYHHDAIDHHGDFLGRRDEFVPWGLGLLASEWDAHTHYITNTRVDIDGDVAHCECYVLFVQRRRDGAGLDLGGGRYIDRLERRDGQWRIAARELVVEWAGEASSTSFGGTEAYPHGTWDHDDPSYRRPFELPAPQGRAPGPG